MSSKITKKMISNVDNMVVKASTAVKLADQPTSKRRAAKRALIGAISKRGSKQSGLGAAPAVSGSASKKARNKGRRKVGVLEQARRELRGASRYERNVRLLSYSRQRGQDGSKGGSKSKKTMERLLLLDVKKAAKSGRG